MKRWRPRTRRAGEASISQINVTNLVDVSITTLIIYMLIAPIVEHGIDVRLPQSSPYKLAYEGPVTVSLSRRGLIYLNNAQVTKKQLGDQLRSLTRAKPDIPVIVRADDDLAYREIVSVLDIAKVSGVSNLGLATRVER